MSDYRLRSRTRRGGRGLRAASARERLEVRRRRSTSTRGSASEVEVLERPQPVSDQRSRSARVRVVESVTRIAVKRGRAADGSPARRHVSRDDVAIEAPARSARRQQRDRRARATRIAERKRSSGLALDPRDDLRGSERIAAQREEVVVLADRCRRSGRRPRSAASQALTLAVALGAADATVGSGNARRSTLPFAPSGSCVELDECRREASSPAGGRQARCAQIGRSIFAPAIGDDVRDEPSVAARSLAYRRCGIANSLDAEELTLDLSGLDRAFRAP